MQALVATFSIVDNNDSAKSWKMHPVCSGNTLSASMPDPDKRSQDIIQLGIFAPLPKEGTMSCTTQFSEHADDKNAA